MHTPSTALAELMQQYLHCPVPADALQLIATGASGRSIMRADLAQACGVLGIYWTADRADNASFVPAARGLAAAGVRVPEVLCTADYGQGRGACLVRDLGSTDLLSLKSAPWPIRKAAYAKALQALIPLHRLQPDWELQPGFDSAMYRWEQSYFAEHLIGRHLGMDSAVFTAHPALQQMADELAALPRVPVHRDCQSQNIMLHEGQAWLIDFQGMRPGRAEYDIASLIYDPYMDFSAQESAELLDLYSELNGSAPDPHTLAACAMQRLMQALGAFANIGHNQHKEWYLNLIPTGLRKLRQVAAAVPADSPYTQVATWLLNVV